MEYQIDDQFLNDQDTLISKLLSYYLFERKTKTKEEAYQRTNEFYMDSVEDLVEKSEQDDFIGTVRQFEHEFLVGCRRGESKRDILSKINRRIDDLYERMKREQILYRDDMQRLYIARYIDTIGIDNFKIWGIYLQDTKDPEKKKWLTLIKNRHTNWINKFLKNL